MGLIFITMTQHRLTVFLFALTLCGHFFRGLCDYLSHSSTVKSSSCYSRTQVWELWTPHQLSLWRSSIIQPTGGRKKGRQAEYDSSLKDRTIRRSPCPQSSLLMHSLSGRRWTTYRQMSSSFWSTKCLSHCSETWLKQQDLQPDLEIDGFGECCILTWLDLFGFEWTDGDCHLIY